MGLTAPVVDGKLQDINAYDAAGSTGSGKSNSSLDKDAFLQLLVAQMKYQDPLEPTSNTEFISQFASFSELEEMQNVRVSMDIQRAQGLVGKDVIVRSTNSKTGNTTYIPGRVDFVEVQNGKVLLQIGDGKYSLDELDTIVDETYKAAYDKADEFIYLMRKLPAVSLLTTDSMNDVFKLKETYEAMNDYEKSFMDDSVKEQLDEYVKKMEELMTLEGLTYEKKEEPTQEDLLQDLLDKIDQIINDMGNIKDNVGKDDNDDGGTGNTEGTGGAEGSGGTGNTEGTGGAEGSGGTGNTEGTGGAEGSGGTGNTEGTGGAEGSGGTGEDGGSGAA